MQKQRSDGEGSIYRRANGRWVAEYTHGWTINGKRKKKTVTAKTRREVSQKLKAAIKAAENGTLDGQTITLDQWLEYWLEHVAKQKVRPTTLQAYRILVRHINDVLGRVRLDKVKPEDIERVHRELNLSPATVLKAHRVLSRALKVAEQRGKISRNPATLVDAPSLPHQEVTPLTVDDAKAVLQAARGRRNAPRWTVALALGLRQGEALGLRWDDVDLDAGTITVRHTLQRSVGRSGTSLGEPKTKRSNRTVLMPDSLRAAMRAHKVQQAKDRLALGAHWVGDELGDFVFTTPKGTHVSHQPDYAEWKKILNLAGVPSARLHDARHTAATMMLVQGVPARVVMEILGHSTIQMTSRYQHMVPELAREAAAMDRALS